MMMMGDELLPKRSPNEYQRLVVINGMSFYIYHVKYSVQNEFCTGEEFQISRKRVLFNDKFYLFWSLSNI